MDNARTSSKSYVVQMSHLIIYTPTQSDRRALAVAFSVPLSKVPTLLTRGVFCPSWDGVTFGERVRGQAVALEVNGREALAAAVEVARAEDRRAA